MNSTEMQGDWNQIKGKLKQKFANLTDNDVLLEKGKYDEMLGRLQVKLGKSKEEMTKLVESLSTTKTVAAESHKEVGKHENAAPATKQPASEHHEVASSKEVGKHQNAAPATKQPASEHHEVASPAKQGVVAEGSAPAKIAPGEIQFAKGQAQ